MRALSIRQPHAELILRGTCGQQTCGQQTCGQQIKPIEFRSRPTRIIGERFHKRASKQWAAGKLFLEGCRAGVGSGEPGKSAERRREKTPYSTESPTQRT